MGLEYSEHVYNATNPGTFTPATPPTPGRLLTISAHTRAAADKLLAITGWIAIEPPMETVGALPDVGLSAFYRIAQSGDTAWSIAASQCDVSYAEWSGFDTLLDSIPATVNAAGSTTADVDCGGAITPSSAGSVLVLGMMSAAMENDTASMSAVPDAGVNELDDKAGDTNNPGRWSGYLITVGAPSGAYTIGATATVSGAGIDQAGITAAFGLAGDPPDPEPDPDPPPYVPPPPARALIEIYVAEEGAAVWDVALWDADLWSTSSWQDITPESYQADVAWGVDRPDAGILADTVAGSWTIVTYDPDRILDPGNADSTYYPELVPGLPIRVSHRGRVARTGVVESMEYSLATSRGVIRATDRIADLATADVPSDTVLSDTLRARARDAIAAAGLDITVEPDPPTGDPALAVWASGTFTAWALISASAREVLHVPYLDNVGVVHFRPWAVPLDRAADVSSPELEDLVSVISDDSLVGVVIVNDEASGDIERRVTPLPRFGERIHRRTLATIDGDAYADAVLLDRSRAGLQYRPGRVYPADADEVERIAAIETLELVTLSVPEASPVVEVRSRILGIRFRVIDLGTVGPDWSFYLQAVTSAAEPLYADDADPIEILIDDDTSEPLYPDGVASWL